MKTLILISCFAFPNLFLKTDLTIKCKVNSCDKYRNVKLTLGRGCLESTKTYYASCLITDSTILIPSIMADQDFKKDYEESSYIKIKLLKGSQCDEYIVPLNN